MHRHLDDNAGGPYIRYASTYIPPALLKPLLSSFIATEGGSVKIPCRFLNFFIITCLSAPPAIAALLCGEHGCFIQLTLIQPSNNTSVQGLNSDLRILVPLFQCGPCWFLSRKEKNLQIPTQSGENTHDVTRFLLPPVAVPIHDEM